MTRELIMTTSWDDGHSLDLRIAELLCKYDLAGTFYVPRSAEHGVMTCQQIRELSKKFEIGGHTLDHVYLDRIPDAEAKEQINGSRRWIEDVTGMACTVFCFPGGKYRKRHLPLVREAGYKSARTVELLSLQLPHRVAEIAIIPTTVQVFPHSRFAYALNIFKRMSVANLSGGRALLHSRDCVTLARELFLRAAALGGVFHLWGHAWEIEQHNQWDELEKILSMMASYKGKSQSVSNGELNAYAIQFI
jgi:peptidoglycan/xylan/chitin deacetylase (PgdA/CDA1 family)